MRCGSDTLGSRIQRFLRYDDATKSGVWSRCAFCRPSRFRAGGFSTDKSTQLKWTSAVALQHGIEIVWYICPLFFPCTTNVDSRACESHDLEFNVAAMDTQGASAGTHGIMVDAIRCHRLVRLGGRGSALRGYIPHPVVHSFPVQVEHTFYRATKQTPCQRRLVAPVGGSMTGNGLETAAPPMHTPRTCTGTRAQNA